MLNLGTVDPGSTIEIPFESFASSTGAPITITGLATSDIKVYKDGGTTERASASGYTLLDTDGIDFDGITGIHGFSISLADNTTADFWAAGSRYIVVVSTITVDSQTMSFIAATFRIGKSGAILDTTISTLASQTSFTLTSGPAEDDALNGHWAVIHDAASAVQFARVLILDYTGSTKTVTLAAGATFTVAAKDNISIMGMVPLQASTIGRTLAVDANSKAPATIAAGDLANDSVTAAALKADAVNKIRDALVIAALSPSINVGELGYTLSVAASFAAAAATDTQTLLSRVTAAVYGFWQNLNVGGLVASSAEATAIQNNTRVVRVVPAAFERPDSGSTAFVIELALYDEVGNMEAPDSAPTLAVVNQSLTSRNANLDSTTMTLVSTGRYRGTYTIDTNHAIEQLIFAFSVIEGGNTRIYMNTGQVVDTTAVDFTSNDRTKLDQILADAAAAVKAIDPNNPLDVSVTGAAKIDWGNIDSPGATVNLPNTTIGPDIYHADIYYTRDDAGAEDLYKAVWFKNGVRITSGITSPTIQVVKEADGTDLIASTAMTEIGTTEAFKYTATTTARQTSGESCLVIVRATIDAAAREFVRSLGRDSTA